MEWYDWRIGDIGIDVYLSKSKKQKSKNSEYNYRDLYRWKTITHPELNSIFEPWISNDKKKFPENTNLSPISANIWFCGDGGLQWNDNRFSCLSFITVNESGRKDFFRRIFRENGFDPHFYEQKRENSFGKENEHVYTRISFSKEQSKELLQWMGGPPPGMEYKWETESYGRYKTLKNRVYDEDDEVSIFDF